MSAPIQYARASDGAMIAYLSSGEGLPLIATAGWVSHLKLEMQETEVSRLYEGLASGGRRRLLRFDIRGTGLSDRKVADLSVLGRARDYEAVVQHAGLSTVNVFAPSMCGPPAIVYAATHPETVARLILSGSFAHSRHGNTALSRALVDLIRAEWGLGSRAIVDIIDPHADKQRADKLAQFFTASASAEVAAAILEESLLGIDVREYLPRLTMPVLVVHRREDRAFPFEGAREMASLIPNAELLPLSGDAHVGFDDDLPALLAAIGRFLGDGSDTAPAKATREAGGLQIILFTDIEGSTTLTQHLGDARAQELLRLHDSTVRDGLRRHGGTQVKHTGDGIMATFPTASGAIDCALGIQRALAGTSIRVRIGLNAGEPVAEQDDLFGTAVQAAARIAARAEPGQILVADVVRQLAAGKGFAFGDRGRVALRGFPGRFRLYEVQSA